MGRDAATSRTEIPPGTLYMLILKTLTQLGPMHGYGIAQHIQMTSDEVLQVEEGSLYPALQRLLREGLLEAEAGISAKGRPTRIYRVTAAGLSRLEQEVSSFEKMFAGITRVLAVAKAYETDHVPAQPALQPPSPL